MIAPSHGQIYPDPSFFMEAYKDWVHSEPQNTVVLPYVSMHGSNKLMVDHLVASLVEKGVRVEQFNLEVTDIGKLAIALVDAGTIVLGTPTIHAEPHPYAAYCAMLANVLRPKAKFLSIIGSYGWGGKTMEKLSGMISNLKVEVLDPVYNKGLPSESDLQALDQLAKSIAAKHRENGFK